MKYETLVPSLGWLLIAAGGAGVVGAVVMLVIRRWSIPSVCTVTLVPVLATLVFLLGFHGRDLDLNYSARPLAREIERQAPGVPLLAVQDVKRDMDYGLAFYRKEPLVHYDTDGVPAGEHLLVIRTSDAANLGRWLPDRIYRPLFLYDAQGLEVYKVDARP
jgi:hypothetical protein